MGMGATEGWTGEWGETPRRDPGVRVEMGNEIDSDVDVVGELA